jgi:hypothetical protein
VHGDESITGAVRDVKSCLKRYIARQLFRQLEVLPGLLTGHRSVQLSAVASSHHRNACGREDLVRECKPPPRNIKEEGGLGSPLS